MDHPINRDVRVALCETNATLRSAFQTALFRRGLREIEICKDAGALLDYLSKEMVDLIICDVDLPGRDFSDLMQEIRRQDVGRNPFAAMLATITEASIEEVRRVMNTGVDRVACKPISMGALISAVDALSAKRKPFVATEAYVGPSRRAAHRPEQSESELVEVPNSLNAKLQQKIDPFALERSIDQAMTGLKHAKVRSNCGAVWRVIGKIVKSYAETKSLEKARPDLARLDVAARAAEGMLRERANPHFADVAASLQLLVDQLSGFGLDNAERISRTLALMQELGGLMKLASQTDDDSLAAIREIAASVKMYALSGR